MSLASGAGLLLNMSLNWGKRDLHLLLVLGVVLLLTLNLVWMGWDFLFAGLSGYRGITEHSLAYIHARGGLTYDNLMGVGDAFDWHKEQTRPFVMRFDDLFGFSLQLLNIWALACCLYGWLFMLLDCVFLGERGRSLSFLQVGVSLRWLDHTMFNVLACYLWPLLLGSRLLLRTPLEFWWLL